MLRDRFARFRIWFDDIFWYHYKWHFIISIVLLAIIGFFILDTLGRTTYDFQYTVISNSYVDSEALGELNTLASAALRDAGSGAPVTTFGYGLHVGADSELGMAALTRLAVLFLDDDMMFFIFDGSVLDAFFNDPDSFVDLGEFGFDTLEGKPWLVELTGLPAIDRIGQGVSFSGLTCYTAIQRTGNAADGSGIPDMRYLAFIRAILESE